MAEFDTSSEEEDNEDIASVEPLRIDWLDVPRLGLHRSLALSALPGCRFKEHKRNLTQDVETICGHGITDVFVLMKSAELRKYRVPGLLQEYENAGIVPHHHPVEDGGLPADQELMRMVSSLKSLVMSASELEEYEQRRVLIHCYGGLGRTGVLAVCVLLSLDPDLTPEAAIALVRARRGARAIQTVRQWNFVQDFRRVEAELGEKFLDVAAGQQDGIGSESGCDRSRSVSR